MLKDARTVISSRPATHLTRQECPHGARTLVAYLETVANRDGIVEKISRERIAADNGVCVRTVTRWIAAARKAGLLEILGGGVRGWTLAYRLLWASKQAIKKTAGALRFRGGFYVKKKPEAIKKQNRRSNKVDINDSPSYYLKVGEERPPPYGEGESSSKNQKPPQSRVFKSGNITFHDEKSWAMYEYAHGRTPYESAGIPEKHLRGEMRHEPEMRELIRRFAG